MPRRRRSEDGHPVRIGTPLWPEQVGREAPIPADIRHRAERYLDHVRSCAQCRDFEEHRLRAVMRCDEGEQLDYELDRLLCERHYEVARGVRDFHRGRDPYAEQLQRLGQGRL